MEGYLKLHKNNNEYYSEEAQNKILGDVSHIIDDIELKKNEYTVAVYDVKSTSSPTILFNIIELDYVSWDAMSIDGVTQDEVVTAYTFDTLGLHVVRYRQKYNPSWGNTGYHITNRAFQNCTDLLYLYIDNRVGKLGGGVFQNSGIKFVRFPSSLYQVDEVMFQNCNNLEFVDLSNIGVADIFRTSEMFQNCRNLKGVKLPIINDRDPTYGYSIGRYAFEYCESLRSIEIKGSYLTTVNKYAFSDCYNLVSIKLPDSITHFGYSGVNASENAIFANCYSLRHINLPPNTKVISTRCFANCTSLLSVNIPQHVEYVGQSAYTHCLNLVNAIFEGDNLTLESNAFEYCENLKNVKLPKSLSIINSNTFYNCIGLSNIKLPDSVTYIGKEAFENCYGLQSITIPSNVEIIKEGAFRFCSGLTEINFAPNSKLKTIEGQAFKWCSTKVKKVTFPDSVEKIGGAIFTQWDRPDRTDCVMEYIYVGSNIQEIGSAAFSYISSLKTLVINATTPPAVYGNNILQENSICKIYVPDESVETYKNDTGAEGANGKWSDYRNRIHPMSELDM